MNNTLIQDTGVDLGYLHRDFSGLQSSGPFQVEVLFDTISINSYFSVLVFHPYLGEIK